MMTINADDHVNDNIHIPNTNRGGWPIETAGSNNVIYKC